MATAPLPTAWLVVLIKLVPAVGRKGPREPSAKSRSRSLFELTIFLRKITSNAPAIRRNKPTQRGTHDTVVPIFTISIPVPGKHHGGITACIWFRCIQSVTSRDIRSDKANACMSWSQCARPRGPKSNRLPSDVDQIRLALVLLRITKGDALIFAMQPRAPHNYPNKNHAGRASTDSSQLDPGQR